MLKELKDLARLKKIAEYRVVSKAQKCVAYTMVLKKFLAFLYIVEVRRLMYHASSDIFWNLSETIYNFSASSQRWSMLKEQVGQHISLKPLSDTRCECSVESEKNSQI